MTSKHLHLDCASGVAGDMLLAALIDAGADMQAVSNAVLALFPDSSVTVQTTSVIKRGIRSRQLTIEDKSDKTFRHWTTIRSMIEDAALDCTIKDRSLSVIRSIAEAEAAIHGVDIEMVHFHEIGAVDTIVDVIGVVTALANLGVKTVSSSPVNVGGGTIEIDHGVVPVPAPATSALAAGIPIYGNEGVGELATPTGMALLRGLVDEFGLLPQMTPTAIGYGAGQKDLPNANVVRATLGDLIVAPEKNRSSPEELNTIVQIETNIDDQSPELVADLIPKILLAGAVDAYLTPIIMKKGRAGTLLTALCTKTLLPAVSELIFTETTTFGIRFTEKQRIMLERELVQVDTPFGTISVKLGIRAGKVISASPEYQDCFNAAEENGESLKRVVATASAAANTFLGTSR